VREGELFVRRGLADAARGQDPTFDYRQGGVRWVPAPSRLEEHRPWPNHDRVSIVFRGTIWSK